MVSGLEVALRTEQGLEGAIDVRVDRMIHHGDFSRSVARRAGAFMISSCPWSTCHVMARYEHIPIYKQAMDVAVHFETIVAGFSRYHKYTLGAELRNQSRAIVSLIIQANNERDKAPKLRELRQALEERLVLIRLAKEVKAFKNFSAYQFVVEQVASVCRRARGLAAQSRARLLSVHSMRIAANCSRSDPRPRMG
jgi:hypothetical protein